MICWPGWMLWTTSWPRDLVLTRSMKSRATLKFTSASSNAMRTSRRASADIGLGDFAQPAQIAEGVLEFLAQANRTCL